jgi:ketosteroid isomerase-like protein
MNDEQAVEAVIRKWRDAINAGDASALKDTWDSTYDHLTYVAEENDDALLDWASISGYYDALVKDTIAWSIDNLRVGVSGNAAWAYLTFVASGNVKALHHHFVWNGRSSFLLHKPGDEWKIIHYHESLSRDRSHEAWGWFFK